MKSSQNIFLEPVVSTIWMPPKQFYWNHDQDHGIEYKKMKMASQEVHLLPINFTKIIL
jgi:hypothetical protein